VETAASILGQELSGGLGGLVVRWHCSGKCVVTVVWYFLYRSRMNGGNRRTVQVWGGIF